MNLPNNKSKNDKFYNYLKINKFKKIILIKFG